MEELAVRVRAVYVDLQRSAALLKSAADELEIFESRNLQEAQELLVAALAEELDAALPVGGSDSQPEYLDLRRSELGEIVAAEVLHALFGTVIPASRIRDKEIPDMPTRGTDVVGFESREDPAFDLILGEVKVSADVRSPPGVVAGMREKIGDLITNRRSLSQELVWLRDHSSDEHLRECNLIYVSHLVRQPIFELVAAPILVRDESCSQVEDPGSFLTDPDEVGARVRFIKILFRGSVLELAKLVYERARSGLE